MHWEGCFSDIAWCQNSASQPSVMFTVTTSKLNHLPPSLSWWLWFAKCLTCQTFQTVAKNYFHLKLYSLSLYHISKNMLTVKFAFGQCVIRHFSRVKVCVCVGGHSLLTLIIPVFIFLYLKKVITYVKVWFKKKHFLYMSQERLV